MLRPSKLPPSVTPHQAATRRRPARRRAPRQLVGGPHVEPALLALGVGVLGGEEAAVGVAQVAQHVADGLVEHLAVARRGPVTCQACR